MGLQSETRRKSGTAQAKDQRCSSNEGLALTQIFGEDHACHSTDLPRFAGTPARLQRRVSCFWGSFLRIGARIAPFLRLGLFPIRVNGPRPPPRRSVPEGQLTDEACEAFSFLGRHVCSGGKMGLRAVGGSGCPGLPQRARATMLAARVPLDAKSQLRF